MTDTTTLNEVLRTPVDGTEFVRLATPGSNWKAQLENCPLGTIGTSKILGGTDTRILFDKAGVVGESTNLVFDYTNGYLTLGGSQLSLFGSSVQFEQQSLNSNNWNIGSVNFNDGQIGGWVSAATRHAPGGFGGTPAQVDDNLLLFAALGDNGSGLTYGALMEVDVDGTPGAFVPTRFVFSTSDGTHAHLERLRIDSQGQVTIGGFPDTFQDLLETVGDGSVFGGVGVISIGNNSAALTTVELKTRGTTPTTHVILQNNDTIGGHQWIGSDGTGYKDAAALVCEVDGAPAAGSMPARLIFKTTPSGTTSYVERLRIDSAGNSTFTGDITSLVQQGGGAATLKIIGTAGAGNGAKINSYAGATQVGFFSCDDGGYNLGTVTNIPVHFHINNTERMKLTTGSGLELQGLDTGTQYFELFANSGSCGIQSLNGVDLHLGAANSGIIHLKNSKGVSIGANTDPGANVIALVNGTTAQAFQIYNTSDNGSPPTNYERAIFDWTTTANVLTMGTTQGGTGTSRGWQFMFGGNRVLDFNVSNVGTLTFATSQTGDVPFNLENTSSTGFSGMNLRDNNGVNQVTIVYENSGAGVFGNSFWLGTRQTGTDIIFVTSGTTERVRFVNTGSVTIGTGALATNATSGFLYIPTCAGTPTGTPTSFTGRVPMVFDTTNSQFWFYTGGAWKQPKTPAGASTVTWQ